jgi:predicted AlkP superfamily pyrophosphatase or phosphodiesterase
VATAATAQPAAGNGHHKGIQHVLLISVDGLHQQDLAWYVRTHPHSVPAALARRGVEYRNAVTPFPSDSFPGLVGQVTGGDPRATGIYYDDTWNHAVFPAGTTSCTGPVPGGEVSYTEAADLDQSRLDAGQG